MTELFANFEVNRDLRWPLIMKLLGGSFALHLLVLATVIYVPGVRDAFNIATLIADTRFVDKAYDKTEIGDDVQLVQLTGDKFRYPEGYWAIDNPTGTFIPPPPAGPQPISPPPVSSQPEPSPVPTPSPSPIVSSSPSQSIAQTNASPGQKYEGDKRTPEEAQKELEKTAAQNNIELPKENEINKKVLKDFAAYANDLKLQGKLDLDKPFEIIIEAELDENGKLKNARFTKKAGDANLVDLFGRMVSAMNDSGFLIYLKPLDKDNPGSKVVFTVKQGQSEVIATVESEASSADSARILAKGFNAALLIGAESRAGKDEEMLLRNTSASPVGKKIVFNFTMPRQAVVDLIKKQLAQDKPS